MDVCILLAALNFVSSRSHFFPSSNNNKKQLINNAGYFYEPEETLDNINFEEQMKQINICAVGPLRVSAAFLHAGLLQKGSKIIMITSQGGSVSWRFTQNPTGHDYGHHVSTHS